MNYLLKNIKKSFSLLVLSVSFLILLSACSTTYDTPKATGCKNRASISINLKNYVKKRYKKEKFVRLGIMPISIPENFSARRIDDQDFGEILSHKYQYYLLRSGVFSSVELIQKPEWPGKKEEFFGSNVTAITIARHMGLDFVMLGYLSPKRSIKEMAISSKIIDVNTGVTVFYGETSVENQNYDQDLFSRFFNKKDPSDFKFGEMTDNLIACQSKMMVNSR